MPGKPSRTQASSPPTSMPSSRALVAATPRSWPPNSSASISRRSDGQVPTPVRPHRDGHARQVPAGGPRPPPARRPCRLRVKAMARGPAATRPRQQAGRLVVGPTPGRPPPRRASGGFHSTKSRSPRGDPSSVTAATGRPHSAEARSPGRPMVAEQNTNVGSDAVVGADPAQAPQDVGHVAAEDPAQHVQLVDDDVAQAAQERSPPLVVGEDADVQHVGVGEHGGGRDAGPTCAVDAGVSPS